MIIPIQETHAKTPKEMLSLEIEPSGRIVARINFSSLDLINTCLRKSKYILEDKLQAEEEAAALTFGTATHKALEHWYTLMPEERDTMTPKHKEIAEMLALGVADYPVDIVDNSGCLSAIRKFVEAAHPLRFTPDNDKRSILNGVSILQAYFKHYAKDRWHVYSDKDGPMIERLISFVLVDEPMLHITFFGTIDVVLENLDTGIKLVTDHKTTAQLGQPFYSRIKPNHQYTGYVLAARTVFGLDTNSFMVNGIQVAKTKQEFARQITERNEEDFEELRISVVDAVLRYARARQTGHWPMTAPGPCSNYGNCQFIDVCGVNSKLKYAILSSKYSNVSKEQ